jgi:2-Cys peroxiredoxin 5
MLALRSTTRQFAICGRGSARLFHSTAPRAVKIGDALPDVELFEDSPGNKVSIFKELKGKGVIVGVPAAYCTTRIDPSFHSSRVR